MLVVQNKAHRTYYDEEVEALQTTAMVLAEMIAVGELERLAQPGTRTRPEAADRASPACPLCEGVGLGHVVLHEPRVVVTELFAEDAEEEVRAARRGDRSASRLFVDDMLSRGDIGVEGEHRDVLEAYRMFANDRGWVRRHGRGDPQRPHRRGRGREGAERHARPHAAPDRPATCASGCTISTTSPTGCSRR